MIKMMGNEIWRGGEKIGWIEGKNIMDRGGKKQGFVEGDHIYDEGDNKIAYVEGDFLIAHGGTSKIPLEKIAEDVEGGVISAITRAAIYILLGS
jgi:hypothetical protein